MIKHEGPIRQALVFGHADGDGHLAAEQSRRNLVASGIDVADVIVDPGITRDASFWEQGFMELDFGESDLVVVVDIMLRRKDPRRSYEAIKARVQAEPNRRFLVIDHHAMTIDQPLPQNLALQFTRSVYECCYGPPSDLMLVAAICDKDEQPVRGRLTEVHRKRAAGIKRAVTDRAGLAGKPTLQLIRNGAWDVFERLADEPTEYHRTMYGHRIDRSPQSPLLKVAHAVRGLDWAATES